MDQGTRRHRMTYLFRRFNGDLAALRQLVEKEFVYNVIFRNIYSQFDVKRFVRLLGIVHLPDVALVIQVDYAPEEARDEVLVSARRRQVWQLIDGLLREEGDGLVAILGSNNINQAMVGDKEVVVLLPAGLRRSGSAKARAREYARFLKSFLDHHLPFTVSIGIGNSYELGHLYKSYGEARSALKHKFYLGGDTIIHFDDVRGSVKRDSAFFVRMETALVEELRGARWGAVLRVMEGLFRHLKDEHPVDPDILRVRLLEMFTVLSRAAMDLGVDSDPLLDLKVRIGQEIEVISTLEEMSAWALGVMGEIVKLVRERQQDAASRAVARAQQYIDQNYSRNISLDEVARRCYLSPSYFSHVFREATGLSFTAYLKRVRVRRAQQLLLTTNKSIGEVAQAVGYSDPNYFSRVFKSVVGKTPYDYRTGKRKENRAIDHTSVQR